DDATGRAASPDCNRGTGHFLFAGIAVGVIVLAGPALLKAQALAGMAAEAGPVQLVPAQRIGNWRASGDEGLNWSPVFHGATTVSQAYRQDNQQVTCFIGYYPRQRQGEELINDLNSIANHDVWIGQYAHERKLTVAGIDRREQLLKTASGGKMLVWYYYNVAGYKTSSRYLAKLYQVAGLLSGDASAYVVIAATPVVTGLPAARSVLADFSESVQQQEEKAGKLFQVVTDGAGQLVHQAFSGNQGRRYMALQGKEK
ncbi:MAG TPA: EpsI family protein, partial [Thiotrichales bacterium]|nr:EpsI family protein [Thiotrichales bacterium]